ncbi:MAG: hypothetical protein ACKV2O_20015 [Acidimicrobiales bacterium]
MRPVHANLVATCTPTDLFRWVEDLDWYPRWLDLVHQATPLPPEPGGFSSEAEDRRWAVVLSAAVGPLRRSKRLTMARTIHQPATAPTAPTAPTDPTARVRFERREPDGKAHAAWVLDAEVKPHPEGAELVMTLSYDGRWWGPLIEGLLAEQINRARPKLAALATDAD